MKKIEKLLLQAYRMGQESVTYMKIIHQGKHKWRHEDFCEDNPCSHKAKEEPTTTIEDEMLKTLL